MKLFYEIVRGNAMIEKFFRGVSGISELDLIFCAFEVKMKVQC